MRLPQLTSRLRPSSPHSQFFRLFSSSCTSLRDGPSSRPRSTLFGSLVSEAAAASNPSKPASGPLLHDVSERLQAADILKYAHPISYEKKNPMLKVYIRYVWHASFSRNNTHYTLSAIYRDVANPYSLPGEEVKISMSTGQVGFKGSAKSGLEAMYQLTLAFVAKIVENGYTDLFIELQLRGFSRNRSSLLQLLNGRETEAIRHKINRVSDGTKLRVGGVRPKHARRV
ncbi:uncharacterized protein V2V93DRAFT_375129 [Kockiozyma suomiensis]|uniref:uncharacterized protein n=1 Tax=Kockiozyma suomiensis TaxID=1337062 RepID=UPI00334406D9